MVSIEYPPFGHTATAIKNPCGRGYRRDRVIKNACLGSPTVIWYEDLYHVDRSFASPPFDGFAFSMHTIYLYIQSIL